MNKEKDCIEFCREYVKNISNQLIDCSDSYKMRMIVFPFFNVLSIYFPEAYEHMLKELKLK